MPKIVVDFGLPLQFLCVFVDTRYFFHLKDSVNNFFHYFSSQ